MSDFQLPTPKRTNGYAIAGLVTSLICCSPLGIIFSGVAISQINRDQSQDGKGLAIAGLVIGIVGTVFGLIAFLLSLYTPFWDEFWAGFMEGYYGDSTWN